MAFVLRLLDEIVLLFRTLKQDKPSRLLFVAFVSSIVILIAIFAAASAHADTQLGATVAYSIGLHRDRSMGEIINYGMAFSAAVLFLLISIEHRSRGALFVAFLMLFVWFDDSASYHEKFGRFLVNQLDLPAFAQLRPQDNGEALAWLLAGMVFGIGLLACLNYRKKGDLGVLGGVGVFFAALLAFGIGFDALHSATGAQLHLILVIIEDGGEMIAVACILGVAMGLNRTGNVYFERAQNTVLRVEQSSLSQSAIAGQRSGSDPTPEPLA